MKLGTKRGKDKKPRSLNNSMHSVQELKGLFLKVFVVFIYGSVVTLDWLKLVYLDFGNALEEIG
jgi:hypothetical protein